MRGAGSDVAGPCRRRPLGRPAVRRPSGAGNGRDRTAGRRGDAGPPGRERRGRRIPAAILAAAAAAGALACGGRGSEAAPTAPPAVVLVVIDALRADHLPAYGYGRDTAPFLARLAGEGVVFERAYSTATWTAPAMASLFTAVYPTQHGVLTGLNARLRLERKGVAPALSGIPADLETLPEAMKRAGYATFGVADNFNVGATLGFAAGFDELVSFRRSRTAAGVNAQLAEWEDRLTAGGPYFLLVHYLDPHFPYRAPEPAFGAPPGDDLAGDVAAYDSEIRHVDGRVEEVFRRFGWERALVVVTADHGEEFGEHGGTGHGRTLHEESLRVPLLVRFPGGAHGGRRVAIPVSLVDVLPTLREAAGLAPDPRNEGRSLLGLVGGGAGPEWEERALFAHLLERRPAGDRETVAAVQGDWKLVVVRPPGDRRLFDLRRDPGERVDRAAAEPAVAARLAARLDRFERTAPRYAAGAAPVPVPLDREAEENLRALGYVQ
jgi:arylsulfatase A-like enzyme